MALLQLGKPYKQPNYDKAHYPHRYDGEDTDIGWCGRPLTTYEHAPQLVGPGYQNFCSLCKKREKQHFQTVETSKHFWE